MKTRRVLPLFGGLGAQRAGSVPGRVFERMVGSRSRVRALVRSLHPVASLAGRSSARAIGVALFALVFAVSCGSSDGTGEAVTSTVPKNGQTNVDPHTIVAIHLSDIMTSVDDNTNPDLITVRGDLTDGEYEGTISVANWDDVRLDMTVDEFSPSAGGSPDDGTPPELDALVFIVTASDGFKEGETITVRVSHDVSARGRTLNNSKTFSFVIRESGMSTEALRLTRTNPRPAAKGVALSPRVRSTFNRDQELTGLSDGMTLRGEHSGVHLSVDSLYTQTAGFDVEITQRLAANDLFLPGEVVEATWNSNLEDQDGVELTPYLLRFQVESGLVNGGWDATLASVDALGGLPVKVLPADFLPEVDGTEFVVVTNTSLELYRQTLENVWTSSVVAISGRGGLSVVDAGLMDLDRDGTFEVLVLLSGDSGGRILTFELTDGGALTQQEDAADVLAGGATGFCLADIDASGDPEVLVLHPRSGSLGSLTLFQLTEFAPDPDKIDPLDPSTLAPRPGLGRVDNPFPSFKEAIRIEAVDLSGNGRLDLVAQSAAGSLTIYRNIGGSNAAFAFRLEKELGGRVLAWTTADVDSDFDTDLVVWDAEGATLYRNEQATISGLTVEGSDLLSGHADPEAFPVLDVNLTNPALVRALELDGDPFLDFVFARSSGEIVLLLGETTDGSSFESVALDGAGSIPVNLVIADVSGDAGQDLVLFESGSQLPTVHLSRDVDAPIAPEPHAFRISFEPREADDPLLRVRVEGDIKERFTGYSVALEYEEDVLTYERFDIPEDFESLANFTVCPDDSGEGCAGSAAVSMEYREEVSGGLPQDGIVLGWFVFRVPTVTEDTTTELRLASFDDEGTTFENAVTVVESNSTIDVPPTLPLEPLRFVIGSPPPDALVVSCSVVERRASDMDVRLSWESPAGRSFTEFVVFAGGSFVLTAPGVATEVQFATVLAGVVNVEVQGRTASESFSAFCNVTGVHEPEVHCEVVNQNENRVSWILSHDADSFRIYRNGQLINTVIGTVGEFRDQSPTAEGADLYQIEAVVSGTAGPRGACLEGPIGDPDTSVTEPPRNVSAALRSKSSLDDPHVIRLSWENGEGYTSIFVARRLASEGPPGPEDEIKISGTAGFYHFEGDPDRGGVPPGEYVLWVRGVIGGTSSTSVSSNVVTVSVTPLLTPLVCTVVGDGDILMTWDRVWQGYTDLEVSIEHRIDDVLQETFQQSVSLESTEFRYTPPIPIGVYNVELVASYSDPLLPPALFPSPDLLRRSCEVVDFDTRILLGGTDTGDGLRRIETGVGLERVEIPIRAGVLGTLSGFEFALEYPEFLTIGGPLELEVDHLGAQQTMTVTSIGGGRARADVSVSGVRILPDQDGDGTADGEVLLATLVGSVPARFAWAGEYPLNFVGPSLLTFAAAPGGEASPTEVEATDGTLVVFSSYVQAPAVEVAAGSTETVPLTVFGTFPEWAPDYRLNSFVIHLRFNPEELEFIETTEDDQHGSAVFGRGAYFLPNAEARARANQSGEVTIPWVGFDLQNLGAGFVFLEPGILLNLATFNFRSRLPGDAATTFSSVEFIHGSGHHNPTAFLPEVDVPGSPDLEGFFGGGVRIVSPVPELSLTTVDPATGPLVGGTEAALRGAGFARLSRESVSLSLVLGEEPGLLPVAPDDLLAITEDEILFTVPDSGLRPPTDIPQSFVADVILDIDPDGRLVLPGAYAYEFPRLTGADRNSGQAGAFQVMVLDGFGFPQDSRVRFVFAGEEPIDAQVNGVAADGRSLQITIPDLRGHEGQLATVEVIVPFLNDLSLRLDDFFMVLADGPTPVLEILEVIPSTGTICGGYEATIRGEEFRPSLRVFFGDEEGIGPIVDDATTVRVLVPPVPEGTTSVAVRVVDGEIMDTLDGAFTYEHPAPPFRRGDLDGDGEISVLDVVRLSDILGGAVVSLPENLDSADANDDGVIDGGDVTRITDFLFGDRLPLPEPFSMPDLDPTPDSLTSCPGTF